MTAVVYDDTLTRLPVHRSGGRHLPVRWVNEPTTQPHRTGIARAISGYAQNPAALMMLLEAAAIQLLLTFE